MIVVFVVDTSPSMAAPSSGGGGGVSRLDVAKMSVENLARGMDRRVVEHNRSVLLAAAAARAAASVAAQQSGGSSNKRRQQQCDNQDLVRLERFDEFLLLSSSLQPDVYSKPSSGGGGGGAPSAEDISAAADAHASCGAGGRLLVGSVEEGWGSIVGAMDGAGGIAAQVPHPPDRADFDRELKRLRAAFVPSGGGGGEPGRKKFPEWAGGAVGLNAALSHGLGLLSRYRLTRGSVVEHFGLGRLPWTEHQMARLPKSAGGIGPAGGSDPKAANDSPLQPACLVLLTDGECLRLPPEEGGGQLSLRFGNVPLREFYREPFRWDQRIFILHVADASTRSLHPSLRALCEVTGGAYMRINQSQAQNVVAKILSEIAPNRPKTHSIQYPLRLPSVTMPAPPADLSQENVSSNVFVNGGPICSFQSSDGGGGQNTPSLHRAMILFAGSCEQPRWILDAEAMAGQQLKSYQSPVWCIPESHFPSKKLDTLPPRPSQPLLHYSRNFQAVGSGVADPYFVMKALHHLDNLQKLNRQLLVDAGDDPPPIVTRMLQRDVYICEWLGGHAAASGQNDPPISTGAPGTVSGREHLPIFVRGAGRPALSGEGGDNNLSIGILHVPHNWLSLKHSTDANTDASAIGRIPTLTLLPPDAHILIPLLIKVAEMEHKVLRKKESQTIGPNSGATAGLIKKKANSVAAIRSIHMAGEWKSDFRAYLFRLPPYYLPAIHRVLRPMLPPSVQSLLSYDSQQESLASLCFSPACLHKIQQGEKLASSSNDWQKGVENNLKMRKKSAQEMQVASDHLRNSIMNKDEHRDASFTVGYGQYDPRIPVHSYLSSLRNLPPPWKKGQKGVEDHRSDDTTSIALLPSSCLLSYYESRRRWIFGGTGLATRGLHVPGVNNDGVNTHITSDNIEDEPLIALAGVGADTANATSISRMGDFKERLSFSPSTFVDYGGVSLGASVTTGADGAPQYTVDDDFLPQSFFDSSSGEFHDSPLARARSRLTIHFGNPFNDKRGGSVVPEKFSSQRPPSHVGERGPNTPPGSPPHDAYDSQPVIEGEGEAVFTGKKVTSPPKGQRKLLDSSLFSEKRKMGEPPLGASELEKKRRTSPDDTEQQLDMKTKPPPPRTSPAQPPPPPRPRPPPPPPRRTSSPAQPPPPPPKPAQKPAAPTPLAVPTKPTPPQSQNCREQAKTQNGGAAPQQQQEIEMQNPNSKPEVKLPEGWMCVWSKSQKRWYFFDKRTNKSVWDPAHITA